MSYSLLVKQDSLFLSQHLFNSASLQFSLCSPLLFSCLRKFLTSQSSCFFQLLYKYVRTRVADGQMFPRQKFKFSGEIELQLQKEGKNGLNKFNFLAGHDSRENCAAYTYVQINMLQAIPYNIVRIRSSDLSATADYNLKIH